MYCVLWWDLFSCCTGVKIGLGPTCKCLFSMFLLDFPIVSTIAVCVSIKGFISLSLEFSSFFKYSIFSLSKSVLPYWLTSNFFKTWFRVSAKVLSLFSYYFKYKSYQLLKFQFIRLLSADSRASIFRISYLFTVSVGTFWVDCIDGVYIFLSIGISGWLEISGRSYWEFSPPIFDSVR